MPTLNCTPSGLLDTFPCLACLSEKELLAVMVYTLSTQTDYSLPDDVPELMRDSACYACMSDKEMLQATAAMQASLFLEGKTVEEVRDTVKCLICATPKQLKAAMTLLLCQSALSQFMNSNVLDSGIATLAGGVALVLSTSALSTNPILLTYYYISGAVGTLYYDTVVDGVSFSIHSSNLADTNKVSWVIIKP